jgi:hypothetical protein
MTTPTPTLLSLLLLVLVVAAAMLPTCLAFIVGPNIPVVLSPETTAAMRSAGGGPSARSETPSRHSLRYGPSITTIRRDVCIAGAGYSGMSTALEVVQNGGSVIVFETDDRVAGNCNTVPDNSGIPLDIGQFAFTNTTTLTSLGMSFWGSFDSAAYLNNLTNGRVLPFSLGAPTPTFLTNFRTGQNYTSIYTPADFGAAFGRLFALVDKYPWTDPADRPTEIDPDSELLKPWSWTIDQYDLYPLVETLFPNTIVAVADYQDVLTLYALMDLKKALLYIFSLPNVGMFINGGCQHVFDGYVDRIGAENIMLNVEYLDVERAPNGSSQPNRFTVRTKIDGRKRIVDVECDAFVAAFPVTGESFDFLDPTAREQSAYGPVDARFIATMAWEADGPLMQPGSSFILYNRDPTQPLGVPAPPCVQSMSRSFPVGNGTNYLTAKETLSVKEVYKVFRKQTKNISAGFITDPQIKVMYRHIDYQPNAPAWALIGPNNVYGQVKTNNAQFHMKTIVSGTFAGDNDATLEILRGIEVAQLLRTFGVY